MYLKLPTSQNPPKIFKLLFIIYWCHNLLQAIEFTKLVLLCLIAMWWSKIHWLQRMLYLKGLSRICKTFRYKCNTLEFANIYNVYYTYIGKVILVTEQEMNGKSSVYIKYTASFQVNITIGTKLQNKEWCISRFSGWL